MAFTRMILAVLVGISVAIVPVISASAISTKTVETSMADKGDMPCCPSCDSQSDSKALACGLKCISLASAVLPATYAPLLYIVSGSQLSFADDTLHGLERAPPTHPPPA